MPNTIGESDKIVNQALPINNTPPTKIALKRKYDTRKTQVQSAASPEPSSHAAVAYSMNKNQTCLSKVSLSSFSAEQNGTLLQQKEQELECKNCHEKYSMIKAFSNHLAIEIHLQNECLNTMIDYEPVFDSKYLSEQFKKLQVDFEVMECTCKSILLSQAEFNSHLKRGRCEKDLKCPFDNCSKSFGPCSDWNMHVKEYHGISVRVQKQLYGCGACDKIVETKLELEKHRNSGFHPNHVLCCGHKFSYERDYNSHRSSDHDFKTPRPSIYNCEQLDCDFTCFDERFLRIHMNTCHFQELFQCNFDEKDRINNDCYRIFKTEADWYKHLDQHVSVGYCTFCKASLFHKCYWKKPKLMHIDPKSRLACQYTTSFCKSLEETVFETVQETGSVQSETSASHDQHEQSGTKQASKEATIQNTDKAGTTAADDEKTLNVTTQQKESNQTVQNNFTGHS
ncbi:hypothetical protein DPMN_189291 [Dreissena polymorpha]|uniref:C2H2-type domain-containing protein n=1 Tax=Dreissena polymorpha TaxID=45954 RepID=A0A9D4DSI8_DREPO|nr:hypothetical protein DPMN_189291 [Dreissena polymorpha]